MSDDDLPTLASMKGAAAGIDLPGGGVEFIRTLRRRADMKPGDNVRLSRDVETLGRIYPAGMVATITAIAPDYGIANLAATNGTPIISCCPIDALAPIETPKKKPTKKPTKKPAKRKPKSKPKQPANPARLFD